MDTHQYKFITHSHHYKFIAHSLREHHQYKFITHSHDIDVTWQPVLNGLRAPAQHTLCLREHHHYKMKEHTRLEWQNDYVKVHAWQVEQS